jgi:hypothetical protein
VVCVSNGRRHFCNSPPLAGRVPWADPLADEFLEINRRWTPEEYDGINVPILSLQADFEGFFENNLTAKGAP